MKSAVSYPRLRVRLAETDLDSASLAHLRVEQRLSRPTLCELTFVEPTEPISPGAKLKVGVEGCDVPLFSGELTAVEYQYEPSGGKRIRARGYDLLHRLRKRQPVRTHVEVTLKDLAGELAADLGLAVHAEEPGPLMKRLFQIRQSDLDLLIEAAERCGLYFSLRDSDLYLFTLRGVGDELTLRLGDSLLEARVERNSEFACRSVTTLAWDPLRVELHRGEITAARAGRPQEDSPFVTERVLAGRTAETDSQAEAQGQAELDLYAGRERILSGVAEGDPRLRPGAPVLIEGLESEFCGRYVVTEAVHEIDDHRGFVSEISTSPPSPRTPLTGLEFTLGIVAQVDDPEHLGRVKVVLSALKEVESEWLGVVMPATGRDKGMVALPDVGDSVLVLFSQQDPAQAVVLGGLCGTRDHPKDWGVQGDRVVRFRLRTRGGQIVTLDDSTKTVRVENSDGSHLEMSPKRFVVHSAVDLKIEAPGKGVLVRGKTVDFEQA